MADSARIEELKRRIHMDPASIAFAALAEEYRRAERYQEAIEVCTAGLVRHPSYLSAHVTLGRALIQVGRLQEAQQELEFVLKLAPENLAAIRGLAEIHHRLGDDHEHLSPPPATLEQRADPAPAAINIREAQTAAAAVPLAVHAFAPSELDVKSVPDVPTAAAPDRAATAGQMQLAALERFLDAIDRARQAPPAAR
jgi:predicted Zn-dependent protease